LELTSTELTKLKVLIVDSNVFIAKTLFSILEAFEIGSIIVCDTLSSAEKHLGNTELDCIFVDFMMEDRAGLDFIKMVREGASPENEQTLPIILNTGVTDIDTIVMARDAGVTEIISKPFSPAQVLQKLSNAINNQREFIDVDEYIGPNRRRRKMSIMEWDGENDRRLQTDK
jgi:two-component system, chemotaxis family, chemotaxis protein CheY